MEILIDQKSIDRFVAFQYYTKEVFINNVKLAMASRTLFFNCSRLPDLRIAYGSFLRENYSIFGVIVESEYKADNFVVFSIKIKDLSVAHFSKMLQYQLI